MGRGGSTVMSELKVHPLRLARLQHDLTQEELAEATKLGLSTIRRAEQGFPINAKSRRLLCAYFGKTSQELGLFERGWKQPIDEQEVQAKASVSLCSQSTPFTIQRQRETHSAQPTSTEAIDLLSEMPDLVMGNYQGAWLALSANHLSHLFEAGWSLESILEALRVVLQSTQELPQISRRKLLQLGAAAVTSGIVLPEENRISEEEKLQLTEALGKSIGEGWKLFHTIGNSQMLAISQAILQLVKQSHYLLPAETLSMFYSAVYRLIGATLYFQGSYKDAYKVLERAYFIALDADTNWDIAQNRSWQAYILKAQGNYTRATHVAEIACKLASQEPATENFRLTARLLAFCAENAAIIGNTKEAHTKLQASEKLLDHFPGLHEEFDHLSWHQYAGICALKPGKHEDAINELQKALEGLPISWRLRYASTALPLASGLIRQKRLEEALAVAEKVLPVVQSSQSVQLIQNFTQFLHEDLIKYFPHNQRSNMFFKRSQVELGLK
jgi:tetratricopeptide (TPR) repeat protein